MVISTKHLNLLRSMYTKNKAAGWDGNEISEYCDTSISVKQDCLINPLLFALFLKDLTDTLGGVMYADDIIVMADEIQTLQSMISRLEKYCELWNLTINMDKKEIMIFRKSGKRDSK